MDPRPALLCFALSCAVLPASAQVVIGGAGAMYGGYGPYPYGAYPYGGYAPYGIADPWAAVPLVPRSPDISPSCYRYGRCSPADLSAYRYRVDRLERLAPSAPPDAGTPDALRHLVPPPPPTPEQEIRPEFQGSGGIKEEYRDSGRPIDGRQ